MIRQLAARCTLVFASIVFSDALMAREMNPADTKSVHDLIKKHEIAVQTLDQAAFETTLAPKVLEADRKHNAGIPEDVFAKMADTLERAAASTEVLSFETSFEDATVGTTSAGRNFWLFPTRKLWRDSHGTVEAHGHLLALSDSGRWYLTEVGDELDEKLLLDAYPDFAGLEFPATTYRTIEE